MQGQGNFITKGIYLFYTGERYEGGFEQSQKSGYGRYFYSNGNTYTGGWANDLKNGFGTYMYQNLNESYTGHFVDSKK